MIAEVFEQGAISFVSSGAEQPPEILPISLFELFQKFFEKKEEIYLREKTRSEGSPIIEKNLKSIQELQRRFARKIMYPHNKINEISDDVLDTTIGLGIVQK